MPSNGRIRYIDIMKGITILAMVAGHYIAGGWKALLIWSFHMPLFVFLNGYFYKKEDMNIKIKKAAKAYLRPYIIVWGCILVFDVVWIFLERIITRNSEISIIKTVGQWIASGVFALASNSTLHKPDWLPAVGAIWFLGALFTGTVYMGFIMKIKKLSMQIVAIIMLTMAACFATAHFCVPLGLSYGAAFLGWLFCGYQIKEKQDNLFVRFLTSVSGQVICSVFWFAIVLVQYKTERGFNICWLRFPLYGLELIGAFCGIMAVALASKIVDKYFPLIAGIFIYLGQNTIWILCVHAFDLSTFSYWGKFARGGY